MTEKGKSKHTTPGATASAARKARYVSYRALHIREKNKLPRVLRSSGVAAAKQYAAKHGLGGLLAQLVRRRAHALLGALTFCH